MPQKETSDEADEKYRNVPESSGDYEIKNNTEYRHQDNTDGQRYQSKHKITSLCILS
jgi:hypothetical protein